MNASSGRTGRGLLILASILLIVHGAIELLSFLWVLDPSRPGPAFIFVDMARNWQATIGVGLVCGLLRLTTAGGLLANREWGWVLGLVLSAITFAMLTLYLPAGIADAVLAGGTLLALVIGRYGSAQLAV